MKPGSLKPKYQKRITVRCTKSAYSTQIIHSPPPNFDPALLPKENNIASIIAKNARGTGGRSSISGIVATVFGASGFLGRYVVNELGKVGSQVVIPFRGEETAQRHLKVMGDLGQIVPLQCDVHDPNSIEEVISRSNVVINLIGKRWATNNFSLNAVNNVIPENIAKVAKRVGIERFIHVSALGSSPDSSSEWLRSKYAGEVAVRNAFPEAIIVRPAGVFGFEDRILNKWASICVRWPFIPIIKGHEQRREGYLSQNDFSSAIYKLVVAGTNGETYDLAGVETTSSELLENIREITLWEKRIVPIPYDVALKVVQYYQYVRRSRFTVDEVRSLTENIVINSAQGNKTFADLGITPSSIIESAPRFVKHFRNPTTMLDSVYEAPK